MPELPDVEVFRRYFQSACLKQRIQQVEILSQDMLKKIASGQLIKKLKQNSFVSADRYGKYLLAGLEDDSWLVLHFGMTGFLKYFKDKEDQPPHMRMRIDFENGYHLAYDCMRKLGEISWTQDWESFVREKKLGPDPLRKAMDYAGFADLLQSRKGAIKSVLMNQEVLAGIGNIYSDEILYQAKVNPGAKIKELSKEDLQRIYQAMHDVLHTAINSEADPNRMPDSFLLLQRDKEGKCFRCGSQIKKQKFSGRSAYICPQCQKVQ